MLARRHAVQPQHKYLLRSLLLLMNCKSPGMGKSNKSITNKSTYTYRYTHTFDRKRHEFSRIQANAAMLPCRLIAVHAASLHQPIVKWAPTRLLLIAFSSFHGGIRPERLCELGRFPRKNLYIISNGRLIYNGIYLDVNYDIVYGHSKWNTITNCLWLEGVFICYLSVLKFLEQNVVLVKVSQKNI